MVQAVCSHNKIYEEADKLKVGKQSKTASCLKSSSCNFHLEEGKTKDEWGQDLKLLTDV